MSDAVVCGVDIGSRTAKSLLLNGNKILGQSITLTEVDAEKAARRTIDATLGAAGLDWKDISCTVATGYGRLRLPFADYHVTEITCHARGASYFFPDVRTVLDIGGQDCKAIRMGANGRVIEFFMNDKCAAGTGRCLERIAASLNTPLSEIGPLSLQPVKNQLRVDTYCAIFAQMDALTLANSGEAVGDILAAVMDGFTSRVWSMLERVGVQPELCITGGVGKNIGIVKRVEERMGRPVKLAPDPQIIGALGAALIAGDKLATKAEK